jgi:hypothetical protein
LNQVDNTLAIDTTFSGVPVTVNEGTGHDSITLGNGDLDALQGPLIINGGATSTAATDALVLNDRSFTGSRLFTITQSSIAWTAANLIYAGLGSITVNSGPGGNTFDVLATALTAPLTLVGGGSGDTLVGSNAGNFFALAGSNAGLLSGSAYGSSILFSQVGNLTAGSGGDFFQFADAASLTGSITGGGSDTLDYSLYKTSVIVDLQSGFATGVGGSVSGITTVFGGSAPPTRGGQYNLLIGKGGNTLVGGIRRRNILVAGASASTLYSMNEDILIGGTTAYDTEAGLASWRQIAAYWAAPSSGTYATRVAHLLSGTGVPLLDASEVMGNGGGNTFVSGGLVLLYTDGRDNIGLFDPNSQQVSITP